MGRLLCRGWQRPCRDYFQSTDTHFVFGRHMRRFVCSLVTPGRFLLRSYPSDLGRTTTQTLISLAPVAVGFVRTIDAVTIIFIIIIHYLPVGGRYLRPTIPWYATINHHNNQRGKRRHCCRRSSDSCSPR
jgi:hypothetical protein